MYYVLNNLPVVWYKKWVVSACHHAIWWEKEANADGQTHCTSFTLQIMLQQKKSHNNQLAACMHLVVVLLWWSVGSDGNREGKQQQQSL